jgi:hypothetical protein
MREGGKPDSFLATSAALYATGASIPTTMDARTCHKLITRAVLDEWEPELIAKLVILIANTSKWSSQAFRMLNAPPNLIIRLF